MIQLFCKSLNSLLILFFLSACSATSVTYPTKPEYAPKGYKSRGVIKYLNQGLDSIIQQRRENAFKQMYEACDGNYKIISEGQQADGGLTTVYNGSLIHSDTHYWYITYECENNNNQ